MESTLNVKTNYGPPLGWKTAEGNTYSANLHIILFKTEFVLPWGRFLYASGSNDQVVLSFATHNVLVTGYGLDHLLADITAQRLVSLYEVHRADKFRAAGTPEPKGAIEELMVRSLEEEE